MSTLECQTCTEQAPTNYTIHTGEVFVCLAGEGVVRNLGNIKALDFQVTPEFLDHFRGKDGQLDAKILLRKSFIITATLEELNPANMAVVLGETQLPNTPAGCKIPLRSLQDCNASIAAVQFVHTFPCATKTMTVTLWRAVIFSEATFTFGEEILEFPVSFQALDCSSEHPDEPFGVIEFSEECAAS